MDALLLTSEPDVRYFTGFLTRFWESPTRPWFLVVPASGNPIAVIPAIGAALMASTWVKDIRTWRAPDYNDDGVFLLCETLSDVIGRAGRVGVPSGLETHLRMPLETWNVISTRVKTCGDAGVMHRLRNIKSEAEIAKIETTCAIADRAFARVPQIAQKDVPLEQVFRRFQMLLLEEGADWVPYLAGASGQGGYSDVISPATEAPLQDGDVLMLDTGAVRDGYFCDFDRNFAVGHASPEVSRAQEKLLEAVTKGVEAAKPGAQVCDLFHAMDAVLTGGAGGSDEGRLGHGLGMQLTEGVSLIAADHSLLEPGMVLTLEPGVALGQGRMMVHEENIVITQTGARFLNTRAQGALVQI
jgi:Xaa-Pro aminopeptidase